MKKSELKKLKQQHIIAKLVFDAKYRAEVTTFLEPQDFVSSDFREIYTAIKRLIALNEPVDPVVLQEMCPEIEIPGKLVLVDEVDYFGLARKLHQEGNEYRVKIVMDDFLAKSSKADFKFDEEFNKVLVDLNQPLQVSAGGRKGGAIVKNFMDYIERGRNETVGKTGILKVDELIEGLEASHVYSVIAAPGTGKTMFGVQIMHESMKDGVSCMYISNEMSEEEIVSRFIARDSGISSLTIRRGSFETDEDRGKFLDSMGRVNDLFDKTQSVILSGATDPVKTMKAIRYWVVSTGVRTIVLDHLHNFKRDTDLFDSISMIAHGLQNLAQELNVAIVILAQISQESQKTKDIELMTAKGAKDVEEVSNVMIALKRRRVKGMEASAKKEDDPTFMKVIVTKNRDGRTGETGVDVKFPSMVLTQNLDEAIFAKE